MRSGELDLVVGTHALVQEGVEFADLSLAVIDEQHRFGVHQRVLLKEKGVAPDVLIMTATPIPRTLALTYYGDLDVSTIDELPAGRRPVETAVARTAEERGAAYRLVQDEVAGGRQAFVVCAAIDEGNRLQVKAAEQEAERLATVVFPDLTISLLHGRMRPADKEARMEAFRSGDADVLIATTVIEVGVDVPNASVMVILDADRFGIAQLHQLRGRVGRGAPLLLRPVRRELARQPGGSGAPGGDGPHHRRLRARRRGPAPSGRGDALQCAAVRPARPEAGPSGRGRRAGQAGPGARLRRDR